MLQSICLTGTGQMKYRDLNTNKEGDSWDEESIKFVFNKGKPIDGLLITDWREDIC